MAKKCRDKMPWLATFADMVTLLLAFFILLFTVAETDHHRYEQIVRSLTMALTHSPELSVVQQTYFQPVNPSLIEFDPDATPAESLLELFETLNKTFANEQALNQAQVEYNNEREQIKIIFPEVIAFDLGRADLKPRFVTILRKFSHLLRGNISVKVVGHSDKLPIIGGRFRSNWELSSARAAAVIEQLLADKVIRPQQAMAVGYADTQPIAKEDSEQAYALNRRVEIIIEPQR
jgi:chemotaxis protein MotB